MSHHTLHRLRPGHRAVALSFLLAAGTLVSGPCAATAQGVALPHPVQVVTGHGISVSPTLEIVDGIIRGKFHATSSSSQKLEYTLTRSGSGGKMVIGNVPVVAGGSVTDPESFTVLPYATWLDRSSKKSAWPDGSASWLDESTAKGVQTFTVRVGPAPVGGITRAESIKNSVSVDITVNLDQLAPGGTPLAFTHRVKSFDGIGISANFIPASRLAAQSRASTILVAPGLGTAGITDPYASHGEETHMPGPGYLRTARTARDVAYNVVTWDSRGTHGSGGIMQLGNPFFEGRDMTSLIDWVASSTPAMLNGSKDPAIGVTGSSLGGAMSNVVAANDPRTDAMIPYSSWTSADTALNPNGVFRVTTGAELLARLRAEGVRLNGTITAGVTAGIRKGYLTAKTRAALASTGPSTLFNQSQAPSLIVQGITDTMNRLDDSLWNAERILDNPYGVPVKIVWYDSRRADTTTSIPLLHDYAKMWMNKYVVGSEIPDAYTPNFQWWDQYGTRFTSNLYPFSVGFNSSSPVTATLPSGSLTFSPVNRGTVKITSVSLPITVPNGRKVVGSPSVSFDYTGTGNAKAVFARLVSSSTGAVISAVTTPIPVTLDGSARSASLDLSQVVHTASSLDDGKLTLQLVSWVRPFSKHWRGQVDLSNITVSIPTVG